MTATRESNGRLKGGAHKDLVPAASPTRQGPQQTRSSDLFSRLLSAALGVFLGFALVKFGNPPILEKFVEPPHDIYELLFNYPWPIGWAYAGLILLLLGSLRSLPTWQFSPKWLFVLLLAWLCWQWVATSESVDAGLSWPTFWHLGACVACFYLGSLVLAEPRSLNGFLTGLLIGFFLMLLNGWQQRFGGLVEARNYFWTYVYPSLTNPPADYLTKMSSNRIWATLFYPNALAGALLLLLPCSLVAVWRVGGGGRMTPAARWFLVATAVVAGLGCLFWSGSKGGWLLMLFLGVLALLQVKFQRALKLAIVGLVLIGGISGFFWKYASFFQKGATSVGARLDYWQAAVHTAQTKPWVGSGPGTFAIAYAAVKKPKSEMARLTHNDYLEQASDSGVPGFMLYAAFIVGGLFVGYPRQQPDPERRMLYFALWLGVLGWGLQGLLEFGLYIPALAWPAFTLLGLLAGSSPPKRMDKPSLAS